MPPARKTDTSTRSPGAAAGRRPPGARRCRASMAPYSGQHRRRCCAAGTGAGRGPCRRPSARAGRAARRRARHPPRRGAVPAERVKSLQQLWAIRPPAGRGRSRPARAARSGAGRGTSSRFQLLFAPLSQRSANATSCARVAAEIVRLAPEVDRALHRLRGRVGLVRARRVFSSRSRTALRRRRSSAPRQVPVSSQRSSSQPATFGGWKSRWRIRSDIHVHDSVSTPRFMPRSSPARYTTGGFTMRGPR